MLVSFLMAVAVLLTGCTLNAGSKFADEYERYLDGRDDVIAYQVRGHNDLPGQGSADTRVDLADGLTDAQIAKAVGELAGHPSQRSIAHHNLAVYFDTPNASGRPARVAVFVRTGDDPLQDTSARALTERIGQVRAFAATDPGLTELSAYISELRAQTDGDPFVSADALTAYLETEPPGVRRLTAATGRVGSLGAVSFDAGDSVAALRPMRELLATLPPGLIPLRWWANSEMPVDTAEFEVDLPTGTDPAVLAGLEQRAAALGVPLRALIAR